MKELYPEQYWEWQGLAGHFCGASKCVFRLRTKVGNYLISTVGAYYPDESGIMKEIGYNRHYETFVFKLNKDGTIYSYSEIDSQGLKHEGDRPLLTDKKAEEMHLMMCYKYSLKLLKIEVDE